MQHISTPKTIARLAGMYHKAKAPLVLALVAFTLVACRQFAPPGPNALGGSVSQASKMYTAGLQPIDLKQTERMMKFRSMVASGKQLPFDRNAIGEIHCLTGGIGRKLARSSPI